MEEILDSHDEWASQKQLQNAYLPLTCLTYIYVSTVIKVTEASATLQKSSRKSSILLWGDEAKLSKIHREILGRKT